ncbi:hypothetical protein JKP88DRAFT_326934 [Tribonema minus]|uniref:Uncharacterized protein n=1 Tax=Tribonema minus TaxID=303371 RepID=A0A836CBX3_9STRA|nr:hypothetical protein JKP88DRAFT_326934 [Tribonema minus]
MTAPPLLLRAPQAILAQPSVFVACGPRVDVCGAATRQRSEGASGGGGGDAGGARALRCPALGRASLQAALPAVQSAAAELVEHWAQAAAKGEVVTINAGALAYAYASTLRAALGCAPPVARCAADAAAAAAVASDCAVEHHRLRTFPGFWGSKAAKDRLRARVVESLSRGSEGGAGGGGGELAGGGGGSDSDEEASSSGSGGSSSSSVELEAPSDSEAQAGSNAQQQPEEEREEGGWQEGEDSGSSGAEGEHSSTQKGANKEEPAGDEEGAARGRRGEGLRGVTEDVGGRGSAVYPALLSSVLERWQAAGGGGQEPAEDPAVINMVATALVFGTTAGHDALRRGSAEQPAPSSRTPQLAPRGTLMLSAPPPPPPFPARGAAVGSALSWALYDVARHPRVQARIHAELTQGTQIRGTVAPQRSAVAAGAPPRATPQLSVGSKFSAGTTAPVHTVTTSTASAESARGMRPSEVANAAASAAAAAVTAVLAGSSVPSTVSVKASLAVERETDVLDTGGDRLRHTAVTSVGPPALLPLPPPPSTSPPRTSDAQEGAPGAAAAQQQAPRPDAGPAAAAAGAPRGHPGTPPPTPETAGEGEGFSGAATAAQPAAGATAAAAGGAAPPSSEDRSEEPTEEPSEQAREAEAAFAAVPGGAVRGEAAAAPAPSPPRRGANARQAGGALSPGASPAEVASEEGSAVRSDEAVGVPSVSSSLMGGEMVVEEEEGQGEEGGDEEGGGGAGTAEGVVTPTSRRSVRFHSDVTSPSSPPGLAPLLPPRASAPAAAAAATTAQVPPPLPRPTGGATPEGGEQEQEDAGAASGEGTVEESAAAAAAEARELPALPQRAAEFIRGLTGRATSSMASVRGSDADAASVAAAGSETVPSISEEEGEREGGSGGGGGAEEGGSAGGDDMDVDTAQEEEEVAEGDESMAEAGAGSEMVTEGEAPVAPQMTAVRRGSSGGGGGSSGSGSAGEGAVATAGGSGAAGDAPAGGDAQPRSDAQLSSDASGDSESGGESGFESGPESESEGGRGRELQDEVSGVVPAAAPPLLAERSAARREHDARGAGGRGAAAGPESEVFTHETVSMVASASVTATPLSTEEGGAGAGFLRSEGAGRGTAAALAQDDCWEEHPAARAATTRTVRRCSRTQASVLALSPPGNGTLRPQSYARRGAHASHSPPADRCQHRTPPPPPSWRSTLPLLYFTPLGAQVNAGWPYLEAALRESLRVHCPGGDVLFRRAAADATVGIGGAAAGGGGGGSGSGSGGGGGGDATVAVPEGTDVLLLTGALTRQDEHFTSAAAFWPERWLIGAGALAAPPSAAAFAHDTAAALPFGGGDGDGGCPGEELALLQLKASFCCMLLQVSPCVVVAVAAVLRRFHVALRVGHATPCAAHTLGFAAAPDRVDLVLVER